MGKFLRRDKKATPMIKLAACMEIIRTRVMHLFHDYLSKEMNDRQHNLINLMNGTEAQNW